MGNSNPKLDLVEAKGGVVSTPRYLKYIKVPNDATATCYATLMYLTSNLLNCEDENYKHLRDTRCTKNKEKKDTKCTRYTKDRSAKLPLLCYLNDKRFDLVVIDSANCPPSD